LATVGVVHRLSVDAVGSSNRLNAMVRAEEFGSRSTFYGENTTAYTVVRLAEGRLKLDYATRAGAVLITASGLQGKKPLVRR